MGFAKIFELEQGDQLLITKENGSENTEGWAQLWFRFRREKEGITQGFHLAYRDPAIRDRIFDELTLEEALKFYQEIKGNKQ